MSLPHEVETEITNLWSLIHNCAAGCISISMWEIVKELNLGVLGTWTIYITASLTLLQAVHSHRKAVIKRLTVEATRVEPRDDKAT